MSLFRVKYLSFFFILISLFSFLNIIYSYYFNLYLNLNTYYFSFIASSVITLVFGVLFVLSNLDYDKKINLQQAFLLTTLSWLTIAIFGALPFYFSNLSLSFTNSFFESMSGLTTTGSKIISIKI